MFKGPAQLIKDEMRSVQEAEGDTPAAAGDGHSAQLTLCVLAASPMLSGAVEHPG